MRLPNHLGDVCMALPALDLLAAQGFALKLVGRAWSAQLFGAYDWPVHPLPGSARANVAALRLLRSGSARALLLTNSFSSALQFRLAGFASTGYARGGRSWLLGNAVRVDPRDHMVEYYWRLASSCVSAAPGVAPPPSLRLRPSDRARARELLDRAAVSGPYCVLCPLAIGTHRGRVKAWSGFAQLGADLAQRGHAVVAMPGPGETAAVRAVLPRATGLPESDVASFAAVLAGAALVVANDSGSGHLAAAVGAPLVSVFGVTEMKHTQPLGHNVRLIGAAHGWPRYDEVVAAAVAALAARP